MRAFFFVLFDNSGEGKPPVAHVIGVEIAELCISKATLEMVMRPERGAWAF